VSDQAKYFIGEVMSNIYKLLQITKIQSSSYHASSNGVCERVNHSIKTMISHYIAEDAQNWQ
jgi:hypothetical protein